jgi:acyl-CoA synthetase (AMP-forming)/AMP-acid ligase II
MSSADHPHLLSALFERAHHSPDAPALDLIHAAGAPERLSVAAICAEIGAASDALRARGVAAGDVVVVVLGHGLPLVRSFLGAMHSGCAPVIFASYVEAAGDLAPRAGRLRQLVQTSKARFAITGAENVDDCTALLEDLGCRVLSAEALGRTDLRSPPSTPVSADVAFLQFTSGSAGPPKGIPQTHRRVFRYLRAKQRIEMARRGDIYVSWLPLYHDLGLVSGLLTPLALGIPTALISPHHWVRRPAVLLRTISDLRATMSFMPNFGLEHCARAVRDQDLAGLDLSSLETLVHGAEMVHRASQLRFIERFAPFGFRESALCAGYGMAEVIEGATLSKRGGPQKVDWVARRSLRDDRRAEPCGDAAAGSIAVVCCGEPFPGTEIRILADSGEALTDRTVGEIAVRSDYMFETYCRGGAAPTSPLDDGWYRTGDLGYLVDGSLYATGRKSDLIIVGGRNLSPDEIEAVADGVAGLRPGRSVAFGIADASTGSERIVLACEVAAECDRATALALERELRRRMVDELEVALGEVCLVPHGWMIKTSSGKKARGQNRDKYLREYGVPATTEAD